MAWGSANKCVYIYVYATLLYYTREAFLFLHRNYISTILTYIDCEKDTVASLLSTYVQLQIGICRVLVIFSVFFSSIHRLLSTKVDINYIHITRGRYPPKRLKYSPGVVSVYNFLSSLTTCLSMR